MSEEDSKYDDARSEECTRSNMQSGHADVSDEKFTFTSSETVPESVKGTATLKGVIKSEKVEDEPLYFCPDEMDTLGKSDGHMSVKAEQMSSIHKRDDISGNIFQMLSKSDQDEQEEIHNTIKKRKNKEIKKTSDQTKGQKEENAKRIWQCSVCQLICKSNFNLTVHKRIHTGRNKINICWH